MAKDNPTRRIRPRRVSVPNNEQAIITIGAERIAGTLCKLSVTGGSIRFARRLPPGTFADVTLRTTSGHVGAAIQFLTTMTGAPDVQAFRFVHMDPTERKRLEKVLEQMCRQGFGEKRRGLMPFVELAQRALTTAKRKMMTPF